MKQNNIIKNELVIKINLFLYKWKKISLDVKEFGTDSVT